MKSKKSPGEEAIGYMDGSHSVQDDRLDCGYVVTVLSALGSFRLLVRRSWS